MADFKQIIYFFSEKMKAEPPIHEIEEGHVSIFMEEVPLTIEWKEEFGGILIESELGFFLSKIPTERLQLLVTKNFLGLETFGNTFCLAKNGITLKLSKTLTSGNSPGECWELLLSFLDAYQMFYGEIRKWPEFTPIKNSGGENPSVSIPNYHILG
jgi:hypothetical protein